MRKAERARTTNETDIKLAFEIDGEGKADISTDVPFMTHMLDLFTKHGQFNLTVDAKGDTEIDDHHTTEDIGICLGQAFLEALGDKKRDQTVRISAGTDGRSARPSRRRPEQPAAP